MKLPLILKQTMVRANAMIVVKAIGLVGKVFMTRLVGAEGMGLYQLAYSFYSLILMIISGDCQQLWVCLQLSIQQEAGGCLKFLQYS